MIRNLKVLGLALVAVLAMSAMVASAASAADAEFTSANPQTTITAGQKTVHTFEVTELKTTCAIATFKSAGHVGTTATAVTIKPLYTECISKLGVFEVVTKVTGFGHYGEANTCDYVLRADGLADLECTGGAEVTVDAGTCTVHVPQQTGLGTVTYTNGTSNGVHDITANLDLTAIQVTHTDGFGCPFAGNGAGKLGKLTGESTVTGETTAGVPVGITWDPAT